MSSGWVNKFWYSVQNNDIRTVRNLITHGADINHIFKKSFINDGKTALCVAISKNYRELVKLLLAAQANIEQVLGNGETPIFIAVKNGRLPVIKDLVKSGCNINHLDNKHENVLFAAVRIGRIDIVDYLLGAGVNVDIINCTGSSVLLIALELYENSFERRHVTRKSAPLNIREIIFKLIPQCSILNHVHPHKGSALRIAINTEYNNSASDLALTKMLLQHGAVPDRMFFLRFGLQIPSLSSPSDESSVQNFFHLAIHAGANLQKEKQWLSPILCEMPEELTPLTKLYHGLLARSSSPLDLQSLCVITIRKSLIGPLWRSIDRLPLPLTMRNSLKLSRYN